MKRYFLRALAVLLALCAVFSLSACREDEGGGESGNFTAVEGGTAVCRIIYPNDENAMDWRSAANMLARVIKKLTGTAPEAAPDSQSQSGREILIGNTNRAASATAMDALASVGWEYSFSVLSGSLVIAAATPAAASAAVSSLEKQMETLGVTHGEGKLVFPQELYYTYRKPEISREEPWVLFNGVNTEKDDASFLSSAPLFEVYTKMKETFGITAYLCIQGACTDGTYGYFMMDNTVEDAEKHYNYIVKIDLATGEAVKLSEKINLGHANDACYNPDTGRIVVACNAPDREVIRFVDPETLEVTGEKHLSVEIFGITYNAYTGQYVVGLSGGRNLAILDSDFKVIRKLNTDYSSYHKDVIYDYTMGEDLLSQGIDSDGKYIYFVFSAKAKNSNWIDYLVAFDFDGKHQFTKRIPGTSYEVENIFHVGKDIYFSCHGWKKDPCYRLSVAAE